jgi:PAS domain S-box-containing protein
MLPDPVRILLVEDDPEDYVITRDLLTAIPHAKIHIDRAATYDAALEMMAGEEHDVYLLDYRLGSHTGVELLRVARERGSQAPVIVLTGQGDREVDLESMHGGADDYLIKGQISVGLLERSLRYALERARVARALRDSERRLRAVFEGTRDALMISNSEGGYCVEVNSAACDLFGVKRDDLIGRNLTSFGALEVSRQRGWHAVEVQGQVNGEMRLVRQDGACRDLEFLVTPHFLPGYDLSVLRDVTESKRLEALYGSTETLGDVGRLAVGVARDLHTLLADVAHTVEALLGNLSPAGRPQQLAQEASQAVERATALTHQLLALTGAPLRVGAPDLNLVIAGLSETLVRLLGGGIAVTLDFDAAPKPVRSDGATLEQIVLNLAVSARDAMPSGGKLAIETLPFDVAAGSTRVHANLREGRYVLLRVRDTGQALDDKVRARLDETLASARACDTGEGPGLPVASYLVRQMGGVLMVYSEPGLGNCSAAYLPQAANTAEQGPSVPMDRHPPDPDRGSAGDTPGAKDG